MVSDKTYDVRIRFSAKVSTVASEREWQKRQKFIWNKDGSAMLMFEISHLDELATWIMGWGKEAKVLAPQKLAERIRNEHRSAAQQYD